MKTQTLLSFVGLLALPRFTGCSPKVIHFPTSTETASPDDSVPLSLPARPLLYEHSSVSTPETLTRRFFAALATGGKEELRSSLDPKTTVRKATRGRPVPASDIIKTLEHAWSNGNNVDKVTSLSRSGVSKTITLRNIEFDTSGHAWVSVDVSEHAQDERRWRLHCAPTAGSTRILEIVVPPAR